MFRARTISFWSPFGGDDDDWCHPLPELCTLLHCVGHVCIAVAFDVPVTDALSVALLGLHSFVCWSFAFAADSPLKDGPLQS